MLRYLLLSILLHGTAQGFLPSSWMPGATTTTSPELTTFITNSKVDTELDFRLAVGITSGKQFIIDGFQFQLCNEPVANKDDCIVPLPGANGPRPRLSSGIHQLIVKKDGSFINMEGQQTVEPRNGVWEMIWRDDSPAGLIICGFTLDKDVVRNDALLEGGQCLYLTWPVWSKDKLMEQQEKKANATKQYNEYESERDEELEKMVNTPNLLQKALHFRNAAAATERMDMTFLHDMRDIPAEEDVMEIGSEQERLQVVKAGTLWTKTGKSFSGSFRASRQVLLGSATLVSN